MLRIDADGASESIHKNNNNSTGIDGKVDDASNNNNNNANGDEIELIQISDPKTLYIEPFQQITRIKGHIYYGNGLHYMTFADHQETPTILLFIDVIRGQISIYTTNIERYTKFVQSRNWKRGFLINPKYKVNMDISEYPYTREGLKEHLQFEAKSLVIASLGLEEYEILEKVCKKQGLAIESFPEVYDLLTLPIDNKEEKVKELKEMLEGDEETLSLEQAEIVNDNWVYKSEISLSFMRWTATNAQTSGIKIGNDLASWIIQYTDGSVGSLFTQPQHRGNGYAIRVVADILIKVLQDPLFSLPYIYIKTDNVASQSLFRSLGFRPLTLTRWLIVTNK